MAKNKKRNFAPVAKSVVPEGEKRNAKARRSWLDTPPRVGVLAVLFMVVWAFLYVWYGDVMQVAEQRSFFALDGTAMLPYSSQSLGWLYVAGRFMLLACVMPVLGTLLIALLLTVAAWGVDVALRLRGWWHACAVAVPFAYFGFVFYRGLNLIYLREHSWIMTIPLLMAVVAVIAAMVSKLAAKMSRASKAKDRVVAEAKDSVVLAGMAPTRGQWRPVTTARQKWGLIGFVALLLAGCIAMAETYSQNVRITCGMECKMYDQDWDGMVATAKRAHQPSRTVAAYYALALNQNGQMGTELFNIPFQYQNAHITRRDGSFDGGLDFVVVDCNMYAGLTRPAYHEAMEQMAINGPSVHHIKRMVQCALIDGEVDLAEKYLAILKKVPFESDFVEKYSEMAKNPTALSQDAEFASIKELQPVRDNFEQNFREPLFLGYNIRLEEAQSMRGMLNSLYACLYSKDLQAFMTRVQTLYQMKVMMPSALEEGVVVANLKNLSSLKSLGIQPAVLTTFQGFMGDCFSADETTRSKAEVEKLVAEVKERKFDSDEERDAEIKKVKQEHKTREAKRKSAKWADKYRGTYQFYYYFQNAPDENYIMPGETEKGGVN